MRKLFLKILMIECLIFIPFTQSKAENNTVIPIDDPVVVGTNPTEYTPKLHIVDVIKKAMEYASSKEPRIEDYFISSVTYNMEKKEWMIRFVGKTNPRKNFGISLKNQTGEMAILFGA